MATYNSKGLTKLQALKLLVERLQSQSGDSNVIESIKVNGVSQTITDKAVDITMPTKVSDLTNDKSYQTATEVAETIAAQNHATMKVASSVPTAAEAESNVIYLVKNADTGYYDMYSLVDGTVVLLDDTSVDLTGYATKDELTDAINGVVKLTNLSATETGDGNAITSVTYDSTTGEFTFTKGSTFLTSDDIATDEDVTAMLDEVFGTESAE